MALLFSFFYVIFQKQKVTNLFQYAKKTGELVSFEGRKEVGGGGGGRGGDSSFFADPVHSSAPLHKPQKI